MRVQAFDLPCDVPDAFLDVSRVVYETDPLWIPEDPASLRRSFSGNHDWFARGQAAAFCVPGRARAAVFRQKDLCIGGRPAAFFGFWEQTGQESDLLSEAESWARDAGAEVLYGPIDFNTSHRYRVRLDAEPDARTFLGEPYNPAHYPAVLEAAGYRIVRKYLTQIGTQQPVRVEHKERVRDALLGAGYRIDPLDATTWRENIREIKQLADVIFAENFTFAPESLKTFEAGYGEAVARRLCPRTSLLVRGPDEAIVGFVLIYPQYAPLVMQGAAGARISPAALSFEEHWPVLEQMGERTGIVRTIGVHPAHRARGVMDALMAEAVARGVVHYNKWIGALIDASNWSRRFGAPQSDHQRSYALYAKDLTNA